jgi:GTP-binding protein
MTLKIAIVGRPNVGKSTLFNRLVGRRMALVDDTPGVTRDRRTGEASLGGLAFTLIDTAGLDDAASASLAGRMRRQTEAAIDEADICLFMVDAREGISPVDRHFAQVVRRKGKPVILLANKAEAKRGADRVHEAYELGLGEPIAISAEHGEGLDGLYDAIASVSPEPLGETVDHAEAEEPADPDRPLRLAIIGRPNAGKSTLVNALLGEERMLTGPEAGITRDAIASDWSFEGRKIRLWDTAGLRKKARVQDRLEKLSVGDALRAIRFSEVVILVIDAETPFEKQDLQIADLVEREGRALVIALNKWDQVENKQSRLKELERDLDESLPQLRGVPMVALSALRRQNLDRLMQSVLAAYEIWNRRISTAALNRWLPEMIERHPPPAPGGRRIRLRYMTQPNARPPTFVLFCSNAKELPEAYVRYLVNGLRETFGFLGTPIRIALRQTKNPYAGRSSDSRSAR